MLAARVTEALGPQRLALSCQVSKAFFEAAPLGYTLKIGWVSIDQIRRRGRENEVDRQKKMEL